MLFLLALTVNGHWVHDLSKFVPYLHYQEKFGVRYYGLAYVLGFLGAAWLLKKYAEKGRSLVPAAQVMDLLFYLMLGVFVGGRLGWFILYHPELLLSSPLTVFAIWQGGMASHGGFVGVAVALWLYARKRALPFFHVSDIVVSTAPLGLFFGRVANFVNGELWGKVSNVPWAVIFPDEDPSVPVSQLPPRHPSQLYEAALEGLVLLAFMQWRVWKTGALKNQPGRITGEFLIAYAVLRAIGEIFRDPDATPIMGLSRGTFYSIFLIVAGLVIVLRSRNRSTLRTAA
jgi:phosphatidylglycerol---prolipoprotein diacylglyceryl transferase